MIDGEIIVGRASEFARALAVRRGADLLQEHGPRLASRLLAADASSPQFSTGAVVVISATAAVGGALLGWKLHDWLSKG